MFSKKMKKMISATLALLMTGSMVACGGGENPDDDIILGEGQTLIEISAFNGGYGLDWLDAITAEYHKLNPDVFFKYNKTEVKRGDQITALQSGSADKDIYITSLNIHQQMYNNLGIVDITDVYTDIENNLIPSVRAWYEHNEKQYAIPWGTAVLGVLYHKNFFAQNNIQVPRTTNELLSAANTITTMRTNGGTSSYAFSYSDNDNECYWDYLFNAWMAQYEGTTNYEKYWDCKLKDGTQYSSEIVSEYQGVLRTLEVYEELLKPSNGYNHRLAKDDDFTQAQFRFLDGQAQMMFNGDWIVQEMEKSGNYEKEETEDVAFMKTPIISSIVETMPMWKEANNVQYTIDPADNSGDVVALDAAKKAKYEKALVAIIDYVDGVTATKPTDVEGITISEADITRIQEARRITPTMSDSHTIVIPSSSDSIDIAKDFIKFIYSDKGIELYSQNVYGTGLPVNYTPSEITTLVGGSALLESAYNMLDNAYLTFYNGQKNIVFSKGGLRPLYRSDAKTFIELFTATAASTYESAYQFYAKTQIQTSLSWETLVEDIIN